MKRLGGLFPSPLFSQIPVYFIVSVSLSLGAHTPALDDRPLFWKREPVAVREAGSSRLTLIKAVKY